jgi:predicted nuclease of predicted toxin-antitoxin system
VKFLLDLNLPPSLAVFLHGKHHKAVHAAGLGLAGAPDRKVLERAETEGCVLLTHDLDFGKILAFSGKPGPSVVIFRLKDMSPGSLADRFEAAWPLVEKPLEEGAVVVIESRDVRIRKLPIRGTDAGWGAGRPTGVQEAPAPYRVRAKRIKGKRRPKSKRI